MPIASGMYYADSSQGNGGQPPIVLIHGAGGTRLHWPAEIRRMSGVRMLALDLPGHGKSEGHGQQSISQYARAVIDWLDAIRLRRAVVVGHSMGGAIALTLGLKYADRVLGLGLVGTGGRLRVAPAILEGTLSQNTFPQTVETIIQWSFSSQAEKRLVRLAARRMAETRPSVLHGDFLACNQFDVLEHLSQIHCPTAVMCGQNDRMTPLRYSEYMAANISNAQLTVIPAAGHMVMLERPVEVCLALADLIAKIPFKPGE